MAGERAQAVHFSGLKFVLLTGLGLFVAACTLILSKEPLACTTNADCTKYPGTVCQANECVIGTATDAGPDVDTTDGPIGDASSEEAAPPADPCFAPNKPLVELKGDYSENLTLVCTNDYVLIGRVTIKAPYTININAGTRIYGRVDVDPATNIPGTLVIPKQARIVALGEANRPIVFTSEKVRSLGDEKNYPTDGGPNGATSGDWGGIYMFGEAPIAVAGGTASIAGLEPDSEYGGTNATSDNGQLSYVRIEYGGAKINSVDGPGLALSGVGSGTKIDFIQIRYPGDDCITINGGTVNLKHYVCQYPYDDGIAWEVGWTGKVQFMFVQGRPGIDNNSSGVQGRSGAIPPLSNPTIYNATFVGQRVIPNPVRDRQQYAVRGESGTWFHMYNSFFTGWEAAIDLRGSGIPNDVAIADGGVGIDLKGCLAFGNLTTNVAFNEITPTGSATDPTFNDDNSFDEAAWFRNPANQNSEADPGFPKCFDATDYPRCQNSAPLGAVSGGAGTPSAVTPPNDGFFDSNAKYIGCWKDVNDNWAMGRWVRWSEW